CRAGPGGGGDGRGDHHAYRPVRPAHGHLVGGLHRPRRALPVRGHPAGRAALRRGRPRRGARALGDHPGGAGMTKPFLEIHDVEDDAQVQPLLALGGLNSDDMGKVLASFRPWPTARVWLIQLALSLVFLLPLLLPVRDSWAISLTLLLGQWAMVV